ncbi:MAG: class II fructose-1,6-bisphosphate aldolase [Acholeplasmatales bacterium]|nr:class II fructose-1,6-bisphosphate aldolase [Acholeplasmatales bacterium]
MPLVNELEMLKKAYDEGYAVGAFNINNMETIQGIVEAAKLEKSPIILQVSRGARKYANPVYLQKLVEAAVIDSGLPIALHLDHGDSFEICKECIDTGFTSVMIDGSSLPYEENVAVTKKVCEYAHAHTPYVTVEGELGTLAGIEDEVNVEHSSYTDPNTVEDFVKRTGVDSLAIAIGTSHGAFKFKPGTKPQLRFDILEEVSRRLPGFPIVLHGASSVLQDYVKMFNECGGDMKDALGVPEELLSKASKMAVCKINIDSDIRLACYAPMRKYILDNPTVFDPRKPLGVARDNITEAVRHKMRDVLHSSNKA